MGPVFGFNIYAEGTSGVAKTWTMKIRQGVEFHNGKTVTPEDVVATLERHSDEKSKSGALGYFKGVTGIKASGKEVWRNTEKGKPGYAGGMLVTAGNIVAYATQSGDFTVANAITGTAPDFSVDPALALLSRGRLQKAVNGGASYAANAISVDWDDNSGQYNARPDDEALLTAGTMARAAAAFVVAM